MKACLKEVEEKERVHATLGMRPRLVSLMMN